MLTLTNYEDYLNSLFTSTANDLFDSGNIKNNLTFIFFQNVGELKDYRKSINTSSKEDSSIYIILKDNGIVRDTEADMKSYLQDIDLEIILEEDYISDISIVLNVISEYVLKNLISINNTACVLKIDTSYQTFTTLDAPGKEKVKTTVNLKFIVYEGYIYSNTYKLQINDTDMPLTNLVISRTSEVVNDGKKSISQKFLKNTSGLVLEMTFAYLDNPILNQLEKDICSVASFADTYKIVIKRDENELINDNFIFNSGIETITFGSIVAIKVNFYPASTIK